MHSLKSQNYVPSVRVLAAQEKSKKIKVIKIMLAVKDAEIMHLKMQNQMLFLENLVLLMKLQKKNAKHQTKDAELSIKFLRLNYEVKNLTKQLPNAHVAKSSRIVLYSYPSPRISPLPKSYHVYFSLSSLRQFEMLFLCGFCTQLFYVFLYALMVQISLKLTESFICMLTLFLLYH